MSKFFTYEERLELQKCLKEGLSFKKISRRLDKNPTTISREIRKYSSEVATGSPGFPFNACKNRFNCRLKKVCGKECSRKSDIYCKLCTSCNNSCPEFIWRKSVQPNSEFHTFATDVIRLLIVHL